MSTITIAEPEHVSRVSNLSGQVGFSSLSNLNPKKPEGPCLNSKKFSGSGQTKTFEGLYNLICIFYVSREATVDRCIPRILNALSAFYGRLCARMPIFAADKLFPYIQGACNICELLSLKGMLKEQKSIEIVSRFQLLIQDINTIKEAAHTNSSKEYQKKLRRRQEITPEDREKLYQITPVDNFCETQIIPSKEELMSEEEPFLRPNLIYGKYPSTLTYLDVQFRLLKEDFLAPLRESVKEYLTNV